MINRYLEKRGHKSSLTALVTDMTRHLHSRQHLGRAVVLCDDPEIYCRAAYRQWLKLSRVLQERRAAAQGAEDILRYTTTITHMQHMKFVAKTPQESQRASVYFVRASEVTILPADCMSVYVLCREDSAEIRRIVRCLPADSLVVDYSGDLDAAGAGLLYRRLLEERLEDKWRHVENLLRDLGVDPLVFASAVRYEGRAVDEILDCVLSENAEFLAAADEFLRAFAVARPLNAILRRRREKYDRFVALMYKVKALMPGECQTQLLQPDIDDGFLLHDAPATAADIWADLSRWHLAAGRVNLARALLAG